jgi:hypothetical protein
MKKRTFLFWAAILAAIIPSSVFGAIVYSGSQNVILSVNPMSPMDSKTIEIGGMAGEWDDFRVELWLDMAMMGMTGAHPPDPAVDGMAMGARLAIYAPGDMSMGMGMGMGMGGILGLRSLASKLAMGAAIGADSFFDVFVEVPVDGADGSGEDAGYIGLRTAMGQYGWLHILSRGQDNVVLDGWACEDLPGIPIGAGQGAVCDWVPGRLHKMHWPQLPDLGFTGIDIGLSRTTLGDDFKCTATGPIRDIHFWGSFRDDLLPKEGPDSLVLELSIYSDVPARDNNWSRPGNLLWTRTFRAGEYSVRKVHEGPEDWYDPVTGTYLTANHRQTWQYNFCIDRDPYVQQEGTIYWLVVNDLSANINYTLGWKTTAPQYGWNDSMVFLVSDKEGWIALAYPKAHPLSTQPLGLAFVITGDPAPQYDLGDAPDSSNNVAGGTMQAYPGVTAYFPTVYQGGSPPYGPMHRQPRDMFYLGTSVSLEAEADVGSDEDTVNNLDPRNDAANRDGADDGLQLPVDLPACQTTTVDYVVTSTSPQPTRAYVNLWCDWNRDGDWDDALVCPDGSRVIEWAVQNHAISLPGPGTYTFTSPTFVCWHPAGGDLDPLWVRLMITEQSVPAGILIAGVRGIGGEGLAAGFRYGETEDYLIRPTLIARPLKYDWGDAPETAAAAGYPTLAASNGARHVPVGPWLGDDRDMPDSEPDGQPDAWATGDNLGGTDDENGVSIPPLTQGEPASATVEVNGGGGVVQAWIDFNGDRTWQAGEMIHNGFLPDGVHTLPFMVPSTAATGQTFARFRISTQGGLEPTGIARDGEVEDHAVSIDAAPAAAKQWCQPPDLTPNGIDIHMGSGLADDFECTSPGKLIHVRLWGSWKGDRKGEIKKIRLRIHDDDPIGLEGYDKRNKFSLPMPEILWEKEFLTGEFQEALYHTVRPKGEWWWDPATGEATPGGDTQVWRLDIDIKPEEAFLQEGTADKPRVYWLAVGVETADGEFGWKTRRWPDHFMDDAVWGAAPTVPQKWDELRYPAGHPYFDSAHNSIDLAFCLRFLTETTPLPTAQAVAITQCPPADTTCPALLTQCPAAKTRCPATPTECQTGDTQCPAVETRCPATATKCPESLTQCPPADTTCPALLTQCPATKTRCPATPTECQTGDTQCPAVETRCPATATKCPESLTQCPPADTTCPALLTQCPATKTRCPATPTECQTGDTQCPAVETRCPATATKCPESLTQCPPTATRCQVVDTECLVVDTRCPPVETKCPPASTTCPESSTKCPPTSTQCPVADTQCPVEDTRCPPIATKCPPASTTCPESLTRCPESSTKCPPTSTQCPVADTQCPVEDTRCPPSATKCPPASTRCPESLTKCPESSTKCPQISTQCPIVNTQCGIPDTRCPAVETKCPVVQTECPVEDTRCPPVETKCPESSTKCPQISTQCPRCLIPLSVTDPGKEDAVSGLSCPTVETFCPTLSDYLALAGGMRLR